MEPAANSWQLSEKVLFRFLLIFLGCSTIMCWDILGDMVHRTFSAIPYSYEAFYGWLRPPAHWLDLHLFHTGYDPERQQPFPGDNHFGVLFYLILLLVAIAGSMVWGIFDRKRPNYNRLNYWFRVYLRYMLALTLITYGLDKLIPVQMTFPNIENLLMPMGYSNRFGVFWNFMGVSPGYQMVTGAVEMAGALLLLNRRTIALGCIVVLTVLINVVSLNVFYNVTVKLFSAQLLLYTLVLLYPYGKRLIGLFFSGQAVSLSAMHYKMQTPWKKNALAGILIGVALLTFMATGWGIAHRYRRNADNARLQKYYEVTRFVAKDTLPALPTDTLRWKRFLISYSNYAPKTYGVVWSMQDDLDYYECEIDSVKRTFTLRDGPDSLHWHIFRYSNPGKAQLLLTGKWKDKGVEILMNDIPIDSMWLNKEKIRLVRD